MWILPYPSPKIEYSTSQLSVISPISTATVKLYVPGAIAPAI